MIFKAKGLGKLSGSRVSKLLSGSRVSKLLPPEHSHTTHARPPSDRSGRAECLWQGPYGSLSLKYLLPGPLRKFSDPWSRRWEKTMAPHSSTVARKIPWTEEPSRLQSMGSRRVRHDWSDLAAADLGDRMNIRKTRAYIQHKLLGHPNF